MTTISSMTKVDRLRSAIDRAKESLATVKGNDREVYVLTLFRQCQPSGQKAITQILEELVQLHQK